MSMEDQPRLCFISLAAYHYFNPAAETQGGGAQRQLYLLSQELKSRFDVHFVVGDYGQSKREVRDGVTLHSAYTPNPAQGPVGQTKRMLQLFKTVRFVDADFYVFRGFPHKAGVLNLWFEWLEKPWLYSFSSDHNLDTHLAEWPKPFEMLFERALSDADGLVAQTAYQAERVAERFGVDSVVIPNGYPPADSTVDQAEREFVLWVGNIHEEVKRPHLFLDLAAQVPETEFVLIGPQSSDDAYQETIVTRSERLDNVEYLGAVDPDEIHSFFRRAKALVNTSPREGFPNTFLEAWRYSTPVLSLDVDPGRFVDFPGHSGYADGDLDRLVDAVRRIDDEDYWQTLSHPAREHFEANFIIKEVAREYERIISQSLSPRRG